MEFICKSCAIISDSFNFERSLERIRHSNDKKLAAHSEKLLLECFNITLPDANIIKPSKHIPDEVDYKRRITWITEISEYIDQSIKNVALVEFVGNVPPLSAHGNMCHILKHLY